MSDAKLDDLRMRRPSELDGEDLLRLELADIGWRLGHTRPRNLEDIETQWGEAEQSGRFNKVKTRRGKSTWR